MGAQRGATGAGIGLAIVRGFVEAHGGTVGVASAPGRGSTFTIGIPLAVELSTAPGTPP